MSEPRYIQSTSGPGWSPKPLTIVEFLTARLDEDAQTAQSASPGPWHLNAEEDEVLAVDDIEVTTAFALSGNQVRWTARHIARHDPAAVLADIAAKRAILALHRYTTDRSGWIDCSVCGEIGHIGTPTRQECARFPHGNTCEHVRLLASVYAYHPDYRQEWKP